MIKKFINWYITKYWKKEYIFLDDIGKALLQAKKNEAERLRELFEIEKEDLIHKFELEKILEIEELKAQMQQRETEMEYMSTKMKNSIKMYNKTVSRSKENLSVSQDIAIQATRLRDVSAEISGIINGISDKAFRHQQSIEDDSEKDKIQLGIIKK